MVSLDCRACAEAYNNGGVLCLYHAAMILTDIKQHGQPVSLEDQCMILRILAGLKS